MVSSVTLLKRALKGGTLVLKKQTSCLALIIICGLLLVTLTMDPNSAEAKPSYGSNCKTCHGVANPTAAPGKEPPAPAQAGKPAPAKSTAPKAPVTPPKAAKPSAPAPVETMVRVSVNGKAHEVQGRQVNGQILVPARAVAPWFGATVDWDNKKKAAIFTAGQKQVIFLTRTGKAVVGGKELAAASRLVSNTAWVPLRFLAENLGATVLYDPKSGISLKIVQSSASEKVVKETKVNHAAFISGPLATGPDVTAQCLKCHEKEAQDILASEHWKWQGPTPDILGQESRTDLGKANGINNFCTAVPPNMPACTKCHIGYGWDGKAPFDFTDKSKIDCLVCHTNDRDYKKDNAGLVAKGVDLVQAAQNVGRPTRANCGTCHFYAGGGDGVKHGDLDSTLINPSRDLDVHMGGANMVCQDCHKTERHRIAGGSVHIMPTDAGRVTCESCHSSGPHGKANAATGALLDKHTQTVACQTCHIPAFARGIPTKTYWDWSTAGQDREVTKDQYGKPTYDKAKGTFVWEKDVRPTYAWYNGMSQRYLLGDPINRGGITTLARPVGNIKDPQAKIYPFKVMRGKQPADKVYGYLLTPKLAGGFWQHYDWNLALTEGAKASGLAYSGQYEFVETEMYIALSHQVAPKEKALKCSDCHSANGIIDFKALGYPGDPMQVGTRDKLK